MNNSQQVPSDEPRGCFQVFAERKYHPSARGYQNFRGDFDSLSAAKAYAVQLFADQDYYTGYEWVQVADVFHGQVWDYVDGGWATEHYAADGEVIEVDDNGGTMPKGGQ